MLSYHLHSHDEIVATLIPLAEARHKLGNKKKNIPLEIINTLISPENAILSEEISNLDPFPEGDPFREINAVCYKERQISLPRNITPYVENGILSTNSRDLSLAVQSKSIIVPLMFRNNDMLHTSSVTRIARLSHLREQLVKNKSALHEVPINCDGTDS